MTQLSFNGHLWNLAGFTPRNGATPAVVNLTRTALAGTPGTFGSDIPVTETVPLMCDYCDQPADRIGRESGEFLCDKAVMDSTGRLSTAGRDSMFPLITADTLGKLRG